MQHRSAIYKNQSGLVSIVVALVIMSIMTLVAVSFAFLTRREQRQALDRQLSSQAFYAAETGINDAVTALKDGTITSNIDTCDSAAQDRIAPISQRQLDASTGVEYTCVLVTPQTESLEYDTISQDSSTVVRIRTPSGRDPVQKLRISWEDTVVDPADTEDSFADENSAFYLPQDKAIKGNLVSAFLTGNSGHMQTAKFPTKTGVLRTTVIPASAVTSTDSLLNNSQTVFLYPKENNTAGNAGSVAFRTGGALNREGVFGSGECNVGNNPSSQPDSPRYCNTDITGVGHRDFFVRLKAVYRPVAVTITALDEHDDSLPIDGAQAIIDSTGKAADVLRRVRVRVPLGSTSYYFPEFAIESANTICKRIRIAGSGVEVNPIPNFFYDAGNQLSGGEPNNKAEDDESCRLPDAAKPY